MDELDKKIENDLMQHNLNRILQLSRRGLLRFLDRESTRDNTKKLRARARKIAINSDSHRVADDLHNAERE